MKKIIRLEWLSREADEALLNISDNEYEVIVFSQPCKYKLGDIIIPPLRAFDVKDLMLSRDDGVKIEKIGSYFEYKITAVVKDTENAIASVGGIDIELDDIPRWASNGDVIDFVVGRLDI